MKRTCLPLGILGAFMGLLCGAALWTLAARYLPFGVAVAGIAAALLCRLGWTLLRGPKKLSRLLCLLLCVPLSIALGTAGQLLLTGLDGYEEAVTSAYDEAMDEAVASHPEKLQPSVRRRLEEANPREDYERQLRQDMPPLTYAL